ncbi:hypothetical protein [Rhodococcus sp. BP22]|uniref:hypothetical protein n=1 Tax=Rhodococcus sp. BP22 TaxID=2758566 RepID=UPI0016469B43|nr:hypothetical protein [Rhodococcus sp. BP22]
MTPWIEVLTALTEGPELSIRGTVREMRAEGSPESFRQGFAYSGPSPMLVTVGHGCRVWRESNRIRIEDVDGNPIYISDGTQAWDFSGRLDRPRVGSPDRVIYLGRSQFLLKRRSAAEWAGNEFAQPVGPVETATFAGRPCWSARLAPPEGKPYPLRIWVDIESGHMLGNRVEEVGYGEEFVDLCVGEPMDDDLFVWTGPTYTSEEIQQLYREERLAEQRQQAQWFADNVTSAPMTIRAPINFKPEQVRDIESGGFDASNDKTMVSRRPRNAEGWAPRWGVLHYVWSTPQWDWAAGAIDVDLDDIAVRELQRDLHPEDPVDRSRRIDPPGRGRVG